MRRRELLAGTVSLGAALLRGAEQPRLVPFNEETLARVISSGRGRPLLIDFWATWCVPCREEMPRLIALAARRNDFSLITVSCDEPEAEAEALDFVRKQIPPTPWYIRHVTDDDRFINTVDIKWSGALPGLFLYDAKGRLARSFIGETEIREIESAIRS